MFDLLSMNRFVILFFRKNAFLLVCFLCNLKAVRADELDAIRARYRMPAVGYIEIINGEIKEPHISGVRKYGTKNRASINDRFHLGSCGKAMTAMLAQTCIVRSQGKLTLGTKLKDLNKIFHRKIFDYVLHEDMQNVTIGDLLCHRSGLPSNDHWGSVLRVMNTPNIRDQRSALTKSVLTHEPENNRGTFSYSNIGYVVIAHILETIERKSWEDLMRERIFAPLGMTNTSFGLSKNADQLWPHVRRRPVDPHYPPEEHIALCEILLSKNLYTCKKRPQGTLPCEKGFILTNSNMLYPVYQGKLVSFDNERNITKKTPKGIKIKDRFFIQKIKEDVFRKEEIPHYEDFIALNIGGSTLWLSELPQVLSPAALISCSLGDWAKFVQEHVTGPRGKSRVFGECSASKIRKIFKDLHALHSETFPEGVVTRWQESFIPTNCYSFGAFEMYFDRFFDPPVKMLYHVGSNGMNYSEVLITPKKRSALLVAMNAYWTEQEDDVCIAIRDKIFLEHLRTRKR